MANICEVKLRSADGELFTLKSEMIPALSTFLNKYIHRNRLSDIGFSFVITTGLSSGELQVTLDFISGKKPDTMEDFKCLIGGAYPLGVSNAIKFCENELEELCKFYDSTDDVTEASLHNMKYSSHSRIPDDTESNEITNAQQHLNIIES